MTGQLNEICKLTYCKILSPIGDDPELLESIPFDIDDGLLFKEEVITLTLAKGVVKESSEKITSQRIIIIYLLVHLFLLTVQIEAVGIDWSGFGGVDYSERIPMFCSFPDALRTILLIVIRSLLHLKCFTDLLFYLFGRNLIVCTPRIAKLRK